MYSVDGGNMIKDRLKIDNIPIVIWGADSQKVIIAVHGNLSNKEDVPIEILAKNSIDKGYQVLSFDLPEHGDRKTDKMPCKVQYCVQDLQKIMDYVKCRWSNICLFANSMGAYFSLLAYKDRPIEKVWFLSPVVDMLQIINNMMQWFQISEERLQREQTISTPIGQNLYWDYYTFVKKHPIKQWDFETYILYGSQDDICDIETISKFADNYSCDLRVIQDAEHYFHTEQQLKILNDWFHDVIK